MPGMNGMELHKRLLQDGNDLPVLFLTGHGDIDMAVTALKRGAGDFLQKPSDPERLQAIVRRLVDENICVRKKKAELEQKRRKYDLLTQREKDVVDLVSQGELNKVIADKLGITLFTVKIHRANACRKLECRSAVEISDFLRDIGAYFSVNKMLTAECYRSRMEKGLTFLEFNYMLMQAYDFLVLNRKYGCLLQLGGDDQWSNILAGADLIRRKERKAAFAMTFTLLTTSEGKKMGKTQKGAVWLDENKTSPYEFYQYWRNTADADVEKCLKLLTFLPLEEIAELTRFQDERINHAKEVLAFELTKMVHGEEKALAAQSEARAAFGGEGEMPEKQVPAGTQTVLAALLATGLCKSNGEARRLVEQGGVSINGEKVTDVNAALPASPFTLFKGKKVRFNVIVG